MFKNNLSLICSVSKRSYEYLKVLLADKINPIMVIIYQKNSVNKLLKNKIINLIKKKKFRISRCIKNSN